MNVFTYLSAVIVLFAFAAEAVIVRKTYGSSIFNDNVPDKAIDGDTKTCSTTGYEIGSWWKVDFGIQTTIRVVQILGSTVGINVRIGNAADELGVMGGFDANPLCALQLGVFRPDPVNVTCARALTGRYLSIQAVDNAQPAQMELCELKFYPFI